MDLSDASTYFCVGPAVINIRIYYFSSECYHSFGRFKGTFSISRSYLQSYFYKDRFFHLNLASALFFLI